MREELQSLLPSQLPGSQINYLRAYPPLREVSAAIGSGPHLVFLDAVSDHDQAIKIMTEASHLGPAVQVLALLTANDPDLILRCLRAGASDFLIQPFTAEQLETVLTKLARAQPSGEAAGKESARIIAVMPAKGACGASTVACNLAYSFRRYGAKRILLADLDLLTGTLSFLLKIRSVHSLVDVLSRAAELDSDLWNAMVTNVNGVDVLLAPEMIVEGIQEARDPSPILDYARHAYDVVILDSGGVYGEWNLAQARAASELLLVTTNELPALQAAQRALSYLDTNRIGRWKVRLVVNRYLHDVGLSREVIGTALHTEVFGSLPSDYEAVQSALMEGKPIPTSTPFGKGIMQLADKLGGRAEAIKKQSSLGGLLGLFSKTSKT